VRSTHAPPSIPVGHIAYNFIGGNIGGPVKHSKLFFFANYLGSMDHAANTNQTNVPSDPCRTGDLSGDPGHPVYDPASGLQDGSGMNRSLFPSNRGISQCSGSWP
jgi:hypothetical protein